MDKHQVFSIWKMDGSGVYRVRHYKKHRGRPVEVKPVNDVSGRMKWIRKHRRNAGQSVPKQSPMKQVDVQKEISRSLGRMRI